MTVRLQTADEMSSCWCGRSPTGRCNGSHTFTDEQWAEQNYEWSADKFKDTASEAWLKQNKED